MSIPSECSFATTNLAFCKWYSLGSIRSLTYKNCREAGCGIVSFFFFWCESIFQAEIEFECQIEEHSCSLHVRWCCGCDRNLWCCFANQHYRKQSLWACSFLHGRENDCAWCICSAWQHAFEIFPAVFGWRLERTRHGPAYAVSVRPSPPRLACCVSFFAAVELYVPRSGF